MLLRASHNRPGRPGGEAWPAGTSTVGKNRTNGRIMAQVNDTQLAQEMARTIGRSMVRLGVKTLMDSNTFGGVLVTPCKWCNGAAVFDFVEPVPGMSPAVEDRGDMHPDAVQLKDYPYEDGDYTVLGPECFVGHSDSGARVIMWRGAAFREMPDRDDSLPYGYRLHMYLRRARGDVRGNAAIDRDWEDLGERVKDEYVQAASDFADELHAQWGRDRNAKSEFVADELNAARENLERIHQILDDAGAPGNMDDGSRIKWLAAQRVAEAEARGRRMLLADIVMMEEGRDDE